jgi:hypothetical protein
MKKLVSLFLAVCILLTHAAAIVFEHGDGIGTFIRKSNIRIADGTELYSNTLQHITEGQNEERYILYTPGSAVMPIVSYGSVLYGMSTINYVADFNRARGKTVVAGINGDFFMLDTGIPIGIVVTEGILRSSDVGVNAVGFFPDGTAMIGKPSLTVNVTTDTGYSLNIDYVNKTRKNYGVYLLTPDFSANTRTSTEGTTIVLNNVSGSLRIGETITATVDRVINGSAPVEIAEGTMVLTATEEFGLAAKLDGIAASSQVTISVTAPDERWKHVVSAVGAGDMLVREGQIAQGLGTGRAPRTAFGITAEGELVFYTVDGRQSGYSNGMTLKALALRMLSLGCVEAVNLDGGGSTVMISQFPGNGVTETVNRPSEGKQRRGANYILFINQAEMTGKPANLHPYPYDPFVLAGSRMKFEAKATDTGYYPAPLPAELVFTTDSPLAIIDRQGNFFAGKTEGRLNVTVSGGGMTGSTPVTIIETPTTISITNAASGATVQSLTVEPLSTIDLNASCSLNGVSVISEDTSYVWSVVNEISEIGSIDANGVFTASGIPGSRGRIVVAAGGKSVEISVSVGASDRLIDAFEGPATGLTPGNELINSAIRTDLRFVRFGSGSAEINYDFIHTEDEAVMLPAVWNIPKNSRYLRLWVYGDDSGNLLGIRLDGGASVLPVCNLDFEGFAPVSVKLPDGASTISGIYIGKASDVPAGKIYIDHMTVSHSPGMDLEPPNIEVTVLEADTAGGVLRLEAKVADNGTVPIVKSQIGLYMDGQEIPFEYSESSSVLSTEIFISDVGIAHRLTLKVTDASGNISSVSYDIEPSGPSGQVFVDTAGHWSEKYAVYLNRLGVISGTLRNDNRYFEPENMMTRAEFAVMMARFLKLDTAAYTGFQLPYADADQIPSWATDSVAAVYAAGVITGKSVYGTLLFDPEAPITRAEVITVLGRTLPKGINAGEAVFSDSSEIPSFAKDYVEMLVGLKVLNGYNDGTIRPNDNVRRGEAVKMLYGMY